MLHGLVDIDIRVTGHYMDTIIVNIIRLCCDHCVFNILSLLLSFLSFIVNNASHFLSVHDHKLQFVFIQR